MTTTRHFVIQDMTVFVFGNPDVARDALPLKILPTLTAQLPGIQFVVKDPNEEWDVPEELTVIDTVRGIRRVTVFDALDAFQSAPRVSLHDFDALANLRYLQKLGKLRKVRIIGIPPNMSEHEAVEAVAKLITSS